MTWLILICVACVVGAAFMVRNRLGSGRRLDPSRRFQYPYRVKFGGTTISGTFAGRMPMTVAAVQAAIAQELLQEYERP